MQRRFQPHLGNIVKLAIEEKTKSLSDQIINQVCCSVNAYQSTPDIPDIQDIQVSLSMRTTMVAPLTMTSTQAMVADMTFGADLSPL